MARSESGSSSSGGTSRPKRSAVARAPSRARIARAVGVADARREQRTRRVVIAGLSGRVGRERRGTPRPDRELGLLERGQRSLEERSSFAGSPEASRIRPSESSSPACPNSARARRAG